MSDQRVARGHPASGIRRASHRLTVDVERQASCRGVVDADHVIPGIQGWRHSRRNIGRSAVGVRGQAGESEGARISAQLQKEARNIIAGDGDNGLKSRQRRQLDPGRNGKV